MSTKGKHRTLPLWGLLKRELANEKAKKPEIAYGQANESKKGEDFTLLRNECHTAMGNVVSTFSAFGLFDGHRGSGAAIYAKENLLKNILHTIPSEITRDEWIAALSRALVSGFVKTDKDFRVKACKSGTTTTLVIIQGWVVTVASVGDSSCILESAAGDVYHLSADHRLECNEEERDRITASGGKIRRLNAGYGGIEFGPLPGGLCLSRSIGDKDVGEFIVPVPFVKQMKLPKSGGRLIISSHGVWDALTAEAALDWCRGLRAEVAASQVVNEALQAKGLRDDTTCIVIDILPHLPFPAAPKKQQVKDTLRQMSRRNCLKNDVPRFQKGWIRRTRYAICLSSCMQSVNWRSWNPERMFQYMVDHLIQEIIRLRPWEGPFLCSSCNEKKEAMDGKRPSGYSLRHAWS